MERTERMETGESLETKYAHIKGWGIDADPDDHPNYPIKHYTGDDHKRLNYDRPEQQPVNVELLKSNERPGPSAVFGSTYPPSGLSGALRRYAFKHSENRYRHWLPLLLADRINVWEGIFDDLRHGRMPNFYAEKGWGAEWKYKPRSVVFKVAVRVAVVAAVGVLLYRLLKPKSE